MSKNTSNTTEYEFEYGVKMVKTYYDTHTFCREDVDDYFEDYEIKGGHPTEKNGAEICVVFKDLTDEEKEDFHKCFQKTYSECDQRDEEDRSGGYEYDGEIDDDERYDDGTPESVTERWDECMEEWLHAQKAYDRIYFRLHPQTPVAPPLYTPDFAKKMIENDENFIAELEDNIRTTEQMIARRKERIAEMKKYV